MVNPSPQDEALASYSVSREVSRSVLKFETVLSTFDATPKVPQHTGLTGGEHRGSRHHLICAPSPLLIETGGSIPLCLQGVPTFPAHLRMRPVSLGNSRRSLVGGATCGKTLISRSTLNKNPMPGHLFESKPVDECTTRRGTDIPMHSTEKHADSKHRSTSVLSSLEELESVRSSQRQRRPSADRRRRRFSLCESRAHRTGQGQPRLPGYVPSSAPRCCRR